MGDWFSKLSPKGTDIPLDYPIDWREGGKVPKYYGGGSVGTPTIVDYFAKQGKTLGGSNKQSLAEMLGRR